CPSDRNSTTRNPRSSKPTVPACQSSFPVEKSQARTNPGLAFAALVPAISLPSEEKQIAVPEPRLPLTSNLRNSLRAPASHTANPSSARSTITLPSREQPQKLCPCGKVHLSITRPLAISTQRTSSRV